MDGAVTTGSPLLTGLDLAGTFAFALNGALTAMKVTKVDIVGVVTLGMVTALGGGIIRDVLLGSLPPTTFADWRYLLTAALGSLAAFAFGGWLNRWPAPILLMDAAGLSLFAVTGASKALDLGVGVAQAVILGTVTAVGGGTLRDVLITRVPVILRSELYAIPALLAAVVVAVGERTGAGGPATAIGAALLCFAIRTVGMRYHLNAPGPPRRPHSDSSGDSHRD